MPDLKRYREKRDPDATPEPFGADVEARSLPAGAARAFVVQQHAARSMHWDVRLEIDGVLVSWAVPKGPTLDTREKRFAAQTEDHPLEYGDFEGIIPTGNYGAGAMILWDRGTYRTFEGVSPAEGLAKGKLDLLLYGHKLRGRFALVRMKGEGGKSWLFLSHVKAAPPGELVETAPESVVSGLTVGELRDGVSRADEVAEAARAAGAPARALPAAALEPMLAEAADAPFRRDGWLFELKYDGARVVAVKSDAGVKLVARSGRDVTAVYPEITRAVRHLPVSACAIDGEVVALDEGGRASFERLQHRFRGEPAPRAETDHPVVFYAFDALSAEGHDLRALGLERRKEILALFAPRAGFVRFADHVAGEGLALFDAARAHEMEGIVAKRADSRYESGRRSNAWLKIKVPRSAPLAIVGWLPGKGTRGTIGSLLTAWKRNGELSYAGAVGSGLDDDTLALLREKLGAARVARAACAGVPKLAGPPVFTTPELVCEVRFTELTSTGVMRHPVFLRLRDDVAVDACEAPGGGDVPDVAVEEPIAEAPRRPPEPDLRLTRLDKVFWPVEGYTKGDLLAYYEAVWPWLGPYLRDRPLVLTRYPDGIDGKSFYQKNAPDFTPDWVTRERIDDTDYFVCNELRTLLHVINSGAIPLHVWSARRQSLERPDWLILDLDPKQAPFAHVLQIARHIHALLDALDARHFIKTSGQDGLHVLLPLGGALEHGDAVKVGEVLARVVVADLPEIATITRPVAARGDKVYVDYLQNGRGKLIASPLSVRPRPHAPVSMPLAWRRVDAKLDPAKFTIKTAPRELAKSGDPFADVLGPGVDPVALLEALGERLAAASSSPRSRRPAPSRRTP